jgi:hypothetical protein
MTQPIAHFVFTPSGRRLPGPGIEEGWPRRSGRCLLRRPEFRTDRSSHSSLRAKWVENELGNTEWHSMPLSFGTGLERGHVSRPSKGHVADTAIRDGICRLSEWLWRLGDGPCEVVDLTEVKVSYSPGAQPALTAAPGHQSWNAPSR